MALESATYINGLTETYPTGSDSISVGDDHIRVIKSVLKKTFPGTDQGVNTIHASATAPSSIVADGSTAGTRGMIWYDTSSGLLKINTSTTGTATWVTFGDGAPWLTTASAAAFGGAAAGYRSFSATKGGSDQGSIGSGTLTKVTWPTAEWDTGGCFAEGSDPDVSVATSRFICNLAGKYHFYFALKLTGNVLYDNAVWLYKNGSAWRYANYFIAYDSGANTGVPTMQMEATLNLADTDYIEVMVHQESGGAQTVDGSTTATWFSGYRIE